MSLSEENEERNLSIRERYTFVLCVCVRVHTNKNYVRKKYLMMEQITKQQQKILWKRKTNISSKVVSSEVASIVSFEIYWSIHNLLVPKLIRYSVYFFPGGSCQRRPKANSNIEQNKKCLFISYISLFFTIACKKKIKM